jgi:hypothetical protein
MGADRVGDVEQRQPHLGGDVVGHRLGERVRRVLLAQPRLELLVEPPGGIDRRHEHLMALRIEQDPPQLREVRLDEVQQLLPGQGLDVALRGGYGRLAAPDQLVDQSRIGLDRLLGATEQRPGRWLVGERRDRAVAPQDGLQGIPGQRI